MMPAKRNGFSTAIVMAAKAGNLRQSQVSWFRKLSQDLAQGGL